MTSTPRTKRTPTESTTYSKRTGVITSYTKRSPVMKPVWLDYLLDDDLVRLQDSEGEDIIIFSNTGFQKITKGTSREKRQPI